jgi:uncharacterized membrane protein
MQDGFIGIYFNQFMTKIFGTSWRTSFWGLMTIISGSSAAITQYVMESGANKKMITGITVGLAILSNVIKDFNTKDKQVSGIK